MNHLPSRQTYDEWRLAQFGSDVSPEGEPGENPDEDPDTNWDEFLKLTDPNNGTQFYRPSIEIAGNVVSLDLPVLDGRSVTVETSTDLGLSDPWVPWAVPGNDGIPLAAGQTNILVAPTDGSQRYYKIQFGEQ
jgi:hypothetical protein